MGLATFFFRLTIEFVRFSSDILKGKSKREKPQGKAMNNVQQVKCDYAGKVKEEKANGDTMPIKYFNAVDHGIGKTCFS